MMPLAPTLVVALLCAGTGELQFSTSRLPFTGDLIDIWNADLDGRHGEDLIVATWSRERGRELAVHFQRPGGDYASSPDRRIPVKADIVAFSVVDVRDEPGAELLLFTRSSCFSYSTAHDGYAGNARRLFRWDFLCDMPSPDGLPYLQCRLDPERLVVPGPTGFGVFRKHLREKSGFELARRIPVAGASPETPPNPHGFSVRFSGGLSSLARHSDLVLFPPGERWSDQNLMSLSRWLHAPALADLDGDGRSDLSFVSREDERSQLNVWLAGEEQEAPITIPGEGELRLVDLDDDGRLDLLRSRSEGRETHTLTFYRNRAGRFDTGKADGVLKFSGFGLRTVVADLDGDGRSELAVTSFTIGKRTDILGVTIERRVLIYRHDPERVFSRRPVARDLRKFTGRNIEELERIHMEGNLSGGAGRDVISVGIEGNVSARRIGKDLTIEASPYWTHRPELRVRDLQIVDLNGDGRSDLVMRHLNNLKVLVSRP